jgi:hypothetical protein
MEMESEKRDHRRNELRKFQENLPIFGFKKELVKTVLDNEV